MENIGKAIQMPGSLESIKPLKDGSMSLIFHSQELTSPEKLILIDLLGQFGWILFRPDQQYNAPELPKEDSGYDNGQSPQKRLRGVIFRFWEQFHKESDPDFESFYRKHIEKIIEQYRAKLL